MADVQDKKGGMMKPLLAVAVAVGLAGFLYVIVAAGSKPAQAADLTQFRKGDLAKLQVPGKPKARDPMRKNVDPGISPKAAPPPANPITGPDGKVVRIADFKGKVLVVNLWATWCAPCKAEMPTLGKLQAAYQTRPLVVMAINTDEADTQKYPGDTLPKAIVRAKAELAKSPPLKFYHHPGALQLTFAFNPPAEGLPTTIIYDKKGVERARLAKDADWNSKEARALIETLLKE